MKAVILAAGAGNRMKPLTTGTHKTLLKVGDEPIISRIVKGLVSCGVVRIVLVTGYRSEELVDYVTCEFKEVDFTLVHNEDYATTNNIQSLALALESISIDEDIVLLESDLIYEPAVLRRLMESKHENVALVDRYRLGLDGTVVGLTDDGVISQVFPPSLQGPGFSFHDKYKTLNIYKFSQEFCSTTFRGLLQYYSSTVDDNCYYELILGILVYMRQVRVHAEVLSSEAWAEVDDPNDLLNAEYTFVPSRRKNVLNSSWGGFWNYHVTDFAFIRNMHFPPPSMHSQLSQMLPRLIENYGSAQWVLDRKMANFLQCDVDKVKFLNGAAQFFATSFFEQYSSEQVLLPSPTFGEYNRLYPTALVYDDGFTFDTEEILSASRSVRLVVVVNPNNPTGTTASSEDLKRLIRSSPEVDFVIDESFIDFSDEESLVSWLEEEPHEHVVVLKSLSKVLGVPGARIGYVYTSNTKWIERLSSELPVWNVNSIAEHFMELVLKYPNELKASFAATKRDRAEFARSLRYVDVVRSVEEGGANFLMVQLNLGKDEAATLEESMLVEHSIHVKDVSDKFLTGNRYWRVAVRRPSENEEFCRALDSVGRRIRL